jgi:hypothetical protein
MPNERNPSYNLTDAQLDDIVDRLLRGRYEKNRPVQPIEAVRTGLIGGSRVRDYVAARWGVRGRWSNDASEGLSAAGLTMRSNKLHERIAPHIQKVMHVENDELIWKIFDSRTYDVVCFAVGGRESAKSWAWTLFGWTLPEGGSVERLRSELVGAGGVIAASAMNMTLVGNLNDRIKEHEYRAKRETDAAERYRTAIESLTGAAAHLASGATAG